MFHVLQLNAIRWDGSFCFSRARAVVKWVGKVSLGGLLALMMMPWLKVVVLFYFFFGKRKCAMRNWFRVLILIALIANFGIFYQIIFRHALLTRFEDCFLFAVLALFVLHVCMSCMYNV